MTRLFLSPEKLVSEQISIDGDQARHLALVLRVRAGEQLVIFDGSGYRYVCRVLQVHKKEVIVGKIKKEPYSAESPVSMTLAQGLPKADKMDLIVQKATELGVSRIIPLIAERSQVRRTEKIDRWRKIALSASQQSGREKIPEIKEAVGVEEFLWGQEHPSLETRPDRPADKDSGGFLGIIFSEGKKRQNLKDLLTTRKDIQHITLLIGPEGGFSSEENLAAIRKGFIEVSLGPRILRTETAPIAAISIINYELGDMG